MIKTIFPSTVKGRLKAPASKSVAQRALAIASLADGESRLFHAGDSDDVRAAIRVCRLLGATITEEGEFLRIRGGLSHPLAALDCGEAGLGIRMFSALAAISSQETVLTGSGSLVSRPMDMIEHSLKAAGAHCTTTSGKVPITVRGPLPGGMVKVDGSVSSQVLTGLLIAAPYALSSTRYVVKDLKSRPYVDITTRMMKEFGVAVENRNYEEFMVPAPAVYTAKDYIVEGDWSGAAFWLVAAAVAGEITIDNLDPVSAQADIAILKAMEACGANFHWNKKSIHIQKTPLKAFEFDATHCPDLFPPLVALAAACKGVTRIKGVSRLKVKESDRATALKAEFGKMGLNIQLDDDIMIIPGGRLTGAEVSSHHDHRIAMACAIGALTAVGPVTIHDAFAVAKSYPRFYDDLEKLVKNGK